MKKIIKLGFIDKKLERRAPFPLVQSDKNSYLLEMDVSKYPDAKKVFIYAKRADGEVVCDNIAVNGVTGSYILEQGMYSVPGTLVVRCVLEDGEHTILTAAEISFEVYPGIFEGMAPEDVNTMEGCIIKLSEMEDVLEHKADKAVLDTVQAETEAVLSEKADREYVDEIKKDVLERISDTSNALRERAIGAPLVLDDISPILHTVDIKLKSKNLIPYPFSNGTITNKGVTFTVNGDQSVTITGTPTENTSFSIAASNIIWLEKGKTYTVSYNNIFTGNEYFYLTHYKNGVMIDSMQIKKSETRTFVAKDDGTLLMGFVVYAGVAYDNVRVLVQLEEGDRATPFTPHINPSVSGLKVYGADENDRMRVFEPSADATFKTEAIAPVMNLVSDTDGIVVEAEYNQDANVLKRNMLTLVSELRQAIIELGGTV